jgi:predicted glycoside hydrolase/deacetylase ChbG (UPF0249 family)
MRRAVINADDFGICSETNQAIGLGFARGVLTSASLMPNMPGFDHAVGTVIPQSPGLGVGIHLVLTSGRPVADPTDVPLLVDRRGLFRCSFVGILALTAGRRSADAIGQIERELTAQFEKLRGAGVAIDHVNSHQHVHMIPAVWRVVSRLASQHGSSVVRLGLGPSPAQSRGAGLSGNVVKRIVLAACAVPTRRMAPGPPAAGLVVRHPDRLAAALDRRGMDCEALTHCLQSLPDGVTEIVTHPSLASVSGVATLAGKLSREDMTFLSSRARRLELEALIDPLVRSTIPQHGIELASFGALSRPALAAAAGDGR